MSKDVIIPNLEYIPERLYHHDGKGKVVCRVLQDNNPEKYGEILFELQLTKEQADMLMEDLYYGEYTGA